MKRQPLFWSSWVWGGLRDLPYPAAGRNVPFIADTEAMNSSSRGIPLLKPMALTLLLLSVPSMIIWSRFGLSKRPRHEVGMANRESEFFPCGQDARPSLWSWELNSFGQQGASSPSSITGDMSCPRLSLPQREESISALLQSINQTLIEGLPEALLAIEPLKLFWEEGSSARLASSDGGDPFRACIWPISTPVNGSRKPWP